jgi:hypothetical protein
MNHAVFAFAALTVLALAPVAAIATIDAQVEASLTYQGAVVKLDHVLIVRHGNEENRPDGPELRIFLSDRDIPLTVAAAANTLTAQAYARRGGFTGVVIVADPIGRTSNTVTYLLHAPGLAAGASVSSTDTDALSQFHVGADRASGAVALDSGDLKLTARFDAPVAANPITADLKGPAALASAPARALIACTAAIHSVDMDAAAKYDTAARMQDLSDFRAQAGEQAFGEALKGAPDAEGVAKTLTRVIVRGPNASAVLGEGTVAELVLEGDGWKCN